MYHSFSSWDACIFGGKPDHDQEVARSNMQVQMIVLYIDLAKDSVRCPAPRVSESITTVFIADSTEFGVPN